MFRGPEFWFLWIFALFEGWNCKIWQFFNFYNPPKLISRKIQVTEKSWNYHTVRRQSLSWTLGACALFNKNSLLCNKSVRKCKRKENRPKFNGFLFVFQDIVKTQWSTTNPRGNGETPEFFPKPPSFWCRVFQRIQKWTDSNCCHWTEAKKRHLWHCLSNGRDHQSNQKFFI